MADTVEEKELGNNERLDQHDRTCGYDGEETDDIHDADCIENYVAWTGQRAFDTRHVGLRGADEASG